ncbi:MAG: tryptophan synthase subunit alpha [Candidatus Omnitrophica bacterium]|nr:tryptophan synthase subunit alpha [Candidatus Omnitrophota bacterium]MCB9721342.1 tryptophan synthase subunit alpha [Candidatus Omnitrophota bacterium]
MNRIDRTFKRLRSAGKKAFVAFITAGDPDLATTAELVPALERAGVDIIELGVPFSDPLADGKTIQAASERALAQGVTTEKIFQLVKRLRQKTDIPLALMTYYNPIFHYGDAKYVAAAASAGVDGLIIPDLPPEEAGLLKAAADRADISTVFFMAPTTTARRMPLIAQHASGFIYFVSLTGVTGARTQIPAAVKKQIAAAKKVTDKPVCIGFGISRPEQVRDLAKTADGVIVGSAIINEIVRHTGKADLVPRVERFVKTLTAPLK